MTEKQKYKYETWLKDIKPKLVILAEESADWQNALAYQFTATTPELAPKVQDLMDIAQSKALKDIRFVEGNR